MTAIFSKKINQARNQKGITLMEMLVAIAIFSILSGVVLVSFQDVRKHDELKESSLELASRLREIQNLAMTGQVSSGQVRPPLGGYGIHIDQTNPDYLIFADTVDKDCNDTSNDTANERYNGNCAQEYDSRRIISLKKNVVFENIYIKDTADDVGIVDVAFKPPKPIPFVGNEPTANISESGRTVYICLRHEKTQLLREIKVIGASGQINEESVSSCTHLLVIP